MKRKKHPFNTADTVRNLLGFIFLAAAVFRIFNINYAISEMDSMGFPHFFLFIIIALEIIFALMFFLNFKVRTASICSALFVAAAISIAILKNGQQILSNIGELFVFNPNPTDILLHAIYLMLLIYLFVNAKKKYRK